MAGELQAIRVAESSGRRVLPHVDDSVDVSIEAIISDGHFSAARQAVRVGLDLDRDVGAAETLIEVDTQRVGCPRGEDAVRGPGIIGDSAAFGVRRSGLDRAAADLLGWRVHTIHWSRDLPPAAYHT